MKPQPLPETSAVQAPPIGLTPLPSAEEVQQAAPGGRADPFGSLVGVAAADTQAPTTDPPGDGSSEAGRSDKSLISHQQNASQGEASRGVLSIRSLHTNKRSKGIHPAAGGSLLHLLSRRQRGQAYRRGLNR